MKSCPYCGRENQDTAVSCQECGTAIISSTAPPVEPQSDPSKALVILRTFDTLAEATRLAASLTAASIEVFIPEEFGAQVFPNVIPINCVTVRVAAKDREAAEAIAVEMEKPESISAATVEEHPPLRHRFSLTRHEMILITGVVVVMPIIFGALTHSIRETAAMGPLFWLWGLLSVGCFFWGRHVSRRDPSWGSSCVAIDVLQIILFLFLFFSIDFPANTRSQPFIPHYNNNPHNW